eukprot:66713-Amphidinium_carterae.4
MKLTIGLNGTPPACLLPSDWTLLAWKPVEAVKASDTSRKPLECLCCWGDLCPMQGGREGLLRIMFRCPHWHKKRRQVELPTDDDTVLACVKLHGLLPPLQVPPVIHHELALVYHAGVTTVWTDGFCRHSSDP